MLMLALLAAVVVRGESFVRLDKFGNRLPLCCEEETAVCFACRNNQTPEEWCKENPAEKSCYAPPGAECGSCFCPPTFKLPFPNECDANHECKRNKFLPDMPGRCTPILRKEGEACGAFFGASTFGAGTCDKGLRCIYNPFLSDGAGKCVAGECCQANVAECLACKAGVTEAQYCKFQPKTIGCPNGGSCCREFTAVCRACRGKLSVREFCGFEDNLGVPGCEKVALVSKADDLKYRITVAEGAN